MFVRCHGDPPGQLVKLLRKEGQGYHHLNLTRKGGVPKKFNKIEQIIYSRVPNNRPPD